MIAARLTTTGLGRLVGLWENALVSVRYMSTQTHRNSDIQTQSYTQLDICPHKHTETKIHRDTATNRETQTQPYPQL